MRVLILEDDIIIARDLIEMTNKIVENVHFANSYNGAIKLMNQYKFDLCLCDINLNEEKTGICFVKKIINSNPNIQVIYITANYDDQTIKETECTNPLHFIVKPFQANQIETSLKLSIEKFKVQNKIESQLDQLTIQEQKILTLITKNKSNKDIAEQLFVSEKTIRNHRYNMLKKLDLPKVPNALLFYGLKVLNPIHQN